MNSKEGTSHPIQVLVADDSPVMRTALSQMLKVDPNIQICGFAKDGAETVAKNRVLKPDVITLDVEMPVLDGIKALKRVMAERPCPVIMVSSQTLHGAEVTLEALDAGAFDYIPKEDLRRASSTSSLLRYVLLDKIEAAARSPLVHKREGAWKNANFSSAAHTTFANEVRPTPRITVIGASTGGPKALQEILTALPGDLTTPILVVQHMPPGFTDPFAKRLDGLCKLRVHEARQGEPLLVGTVYVAPAGLHTTFFASSHSTVRICLADTPLSSLHKPSVDVTMLSAASVFGAHVLGVILTGMGNDGLQGMTAIRNAGGITIGQDEATSAVYGMPRSCAEHGVLQKILPLPLIAEELLAVLEAGVKV